MKQRYFTLFLLIHLFFLPLYADYDKYFRKLDISNGLSQNTVNTILQDRMGFMWFGTKDGLNRFDGLSFKIYKNKFTSTGNLGNNYITCLYEDKDGLIWVGTDVGVYIYDPRKDMFSRFDLRTESGTFIDRTVNVIKSDHTGKIWIAVNLQGLFCYEKDKNRLEHYDSSNWKSIKTNVESIEFDSKNRLWIGFYGDGLYYSDNQMKSIHPYLDDSNEEVFHGDVVTKVLTGPYNCLYVASVNHGIKEINLSSKKSRTLLLSDEKGEHVFCRELLLTSDNEIWIGTESGLYIYSLRDNKYSHITSGDNDNNTISDNAIYSMYKDNEAGIWIGSFFGGINYCPHSFSNFERHYETSGPSGLKGKRIREFCKDDKGYIWIGTEDSGLNRYDPVKNLFSYCEMSQDFSNVHGLCPIGDKLWVGTFSKGLKIIDTSTLKVVKEYEKNNSSRSLMDNSVFSIYRTNSGDIFLGTLFGLNRYCPETDDFDCIEELKGKFVYDIKEDFNGDLWLATYANGVYRYITEEKKWKNYVHNDKDEHSIPYDKVLSIFEDSHHQQWFTTQGGGIFKYNIDKDNFTTINSKNGLPNDVAYQIVEDKAGMLWITTNNGMACLNPQTMDIKIYTTANDLPCNQFNYKSSLYDSNGTIYFGSINGFVSFNPSTFSENTLKPKAIITDFLLFNRSISPQDEESLLENSILFTDKITLESSQNSFSFRLAALGYLSPKNNKIMYMMEGADDKWIMLGESSIVTYSNLHFGNYNFRVKVSNGDGLWNEEERCLSIKILPPWYLSTIAVVTYIIICLLLFVYIFSFIKKKNEIRQKAKMEKFEMEKEREVYESKIGFFTNVAHEIRTPLTLINGPLDNIIKNKTLDAETREDLNIMKQNTERLLNLTNQLLDFRKTESQGYSLTFTDCNVTELINDIFTRFKPLARQNMLKYEIKQIIPDFHAQINAEAFTKILSNLLSNAIKYSEEYAYISLMLPEDNTDMFLIQVANDGDVIPQDKREKVFRPFFRLEEDGKNSTNGTGIGLSLARSLSELHSGKLFIEDSETENIFSILLPIRQEKAIDIQKLQVTEDMMWNQNDSEEENKESTKTSILVVEDNHEMLNFIKRQLSHEYLVKVATNGEEALHVLDNEYVSIIISDVMMPIMDGFEFLKHIKSNLDYSHIPFILLTAKTNIQSKIEGMELGADAFLEKPFSTDYLKACISNLLQGREKLRKTYAASPFVAANTMAHTKSDEVFIKKLHEIILQNLQNPDFSMDDISDAMNMSRSNFYRKIKGVLDMTPNDYLRVERLKKAAQLLVEGDNKVNEICYMVGFNSPSYFSKCFQKQFGVLPKDFIG